MRTHKVQKDRPEGLPWKKETKNAINHRETKRIEKCGRRQSKNNNNNASFVLVGKFVLTWWTQVWEAEGRWSVGVDSTLHQSLQPNWCFGGFSLLVSSQMALGQGCPKSMSLGSHCMHLLSPQRTKRRVLWPSLEAHSKGSMEPHGWPNETNPNPCKLPPTCWCHGLSMRDLWWV